MKKTTKLTLIALLVVLLATSVITLVACDKEAKELAFNSYLFPITGTVADDFTLPLAIGGDDKSFEVEWKSDNDAIKLTKGKSNWLAQVNLGHNGDVTEVNITMTLDKDHVKTFPVLVDYFDVYKFSDSYSFKQRYAIVGKNFALDSSASYKGETAAIAWTVDAEYNDYIAVVGNECQVTVPEGETVDVKLKATFTYEGGPEKETTFREYEFKVGDVMEPLEAVDYWYNNTGVTIEMSGYVVAIATPYDSGYGNVTLYMVNDDFTAGFYLYRVKAAAADGALIEPGVHVTVTGTTNTNYNGLIETNAGGNLTVDTNVPKINVRDHVYAFDHDAISEAPSAIYHESTLVSLKGWKIVEMYQKDGKPSAPAAGATSTLFYVQKGTSKKIAVTISKYLEGEYKTANGDKTWEALCKYYTSLKVGDVIDVTGILGNYNGYQIMPLNANDIKKVSSESAASTDGAAVKAAVAAVKAVVDAKITGTFSSEATISGLPTSSNGVAISYSVCGSDKVVKKTADDTLKVTPKEYKDDRSIMVTYTINDYTAYSFFKIVSQTLTDKGKVDSVKANIDNEIQKDYKIDTANIALPQGSDFGFENVEIEWTIQSGGGAWAVLTGNKLTIKLDSSNHTVVLHAAISLGSVHDEATVTIQLAAKVFNEMTEPTAGEYKLAVFQGNSGKWLFATGELSNYGYGLTTEDPAQAATYTLTQETDGWTIKVGGKYLESAESDYVSGTKLSETATGRWQWDNTLGVFKWTISAGKNAGKIVYLGTFGSNSDIRASETSRITGDRAADLKAGQFVAAFGQTVA